MQEDSEIRLSVHNIGGISEKTLSLDEGVNVLAGPNSTNKTSMLQAISVALGGTAPLKSDTDEGRVELDINGNEYTRTLSRDGSRVSMDGDPYLTQDEAEVAELFAFLLESNEARSAVERGQAKGLRDIIMEPVDTEEIQTEINELMAKRDSLESEIEAIENRKEKLPELEAEKERLQKEVESKRNELSEVEDEIDAIEDDVTDIKDRRSKLDNLIEGRSGLRDEVNDIESRIESEQSSIESLKEELAEKESELNESVPKKGLDSIQDEIEEIETEVGRLRARRDEINKVLSELREVADFNTRMLEEKDVLRVLESDPEESSKTDAIFEDETVCWTCGSEVDPDRISETVDEIKDLVSRKNRDINEIDADIEKLREKKSQLEETTEKVKSIRNSISNIEDEIEQRQNRLKELEGDLSDRKTDLSEVKDEIQEIESRLEEAGSETLEAHRRKKELEVEIESLEDEIETTKKDISDLEDEIAKQPDLEDEIEATEAMISEARGRIGSLETEAVESFNEHMDEMLEILGYENLERIWIEPQSEETKEGRRKVQKRVFDLKVVREGKDGSVYEDEIENLSESEKEVAGLVFALSGYLAHEVHEYLPFMLIDSMGALDSERVDELLDYFDEQVRYLIAAVLPEVIEDMDSDRYNIVRTI